MSNLAYIGLGLLIGNFIIGITEKLYFYFLDE
jgi:hypothetical protein